MTEDFRMINLGSFPQGAVPPTLSHQFLDGIGDPIDLSAGTWSAQAKGEQLEVLVQPSPLFNGVVLIDEIDAIVTYEWSGVDFLTVGRFRLILWVGNSVARLGTPTFEYTVYDAPGGLPSV